VPLLVLAQLNRQVEGRSDHRPRLSDLRESGDVEQEADAVAFIHQPGMYRPEDPDLKGKAMLILEKQRHGPIGEFKLEWDAAATTFRTPTRWGVVSSESGFDEFTHFGGKGGGN
jgi:replicative DNA helicase